MSAIATVSSGRVDADSVLRLSRLRREMSVAQDEMASGRSVLTQIGRSADVPARLMLGSRLSDLEMQSDAFRSVRGSIGAAQISLTALEDVVTAVRNATIVTPTSVETRRAAQYAATAALDALSDMAGAAFSGRFIFGGLQGDRSPMGGASGPSVDEGLRQLRDAFGSAFGFDADDPRVANITAAQIGAYTDAQVAHGTDTTTWRSVWSTASERPSSVRINQGAAIPTSVTTDEQPFRQITLGLGLLSTTGLNTLSEEAAAAVFDTARGLLSDGLVGITTLSTQLAGSDDILSDSIDQNDIERRSLTSALAALESVDPAEVSVRASNLLRSLEAAYTALGRLARLSLLDELR